MGRKYCIIVYDTTTEDPSATVVPDTSILFGPTAVPNASNN